MDKEIRSFGIELRNDEESNKLVGYAAMYDSLSRDLGGFIEKISPGAFAGVIEKSDVRALYNHDSNQLPLGRTPKTLRLMEDNIGLQIEIDLPDTQLGQDIRKSVKRGDISQMSFGFSVKEDSWEERKNGQVIRTIEKIDRLYDVSPVVYPAYEQTKIALRSLEEWRGKNKEIKKDVENDAIEEDNKQDEVVNNLQTQVIKLSKTVNALQVKMKKLEAN